MRQIISERERESELRTQNSETEREEEEEPKAGCETDTDMSRNSVSGCHQNLMGCSHHMHHHKQRLQENPDTVFFSQTFKGKPSRRNLTDPVNRKGTDNGHKQLFARFLVPFVKNRRLK